MPQVDPTLTTLPATNGQQKLSPKLSDVTDGLSNTIALAESAGRPFVYRKAGGQINSDQKVNRVNGGGWARAANDFAIEGSNPDGTFNPAALTATNPPYGTCAINCTNGQDIGVVNNGATPWPYYNTEGTGEIFSFHTSVRQRIIWRRLGPFSQRDNSDEHAGRLRDPRSGRSHALLLTARIPVAKLEDPGSMLTRGFFIPGPLRA